MVRTKEFDEEIVIDRLIKGFLKDSYSSTSVAALESAIGVGRKSLHNTFGNKHDLLVRALENFSLESAEHFIEPLERAGAGTKEVERVVHAMVSQMTAPSGRGGCLLCLSAQDPIVPSRPVARLVDAFFTRARAGFLKYINTGIAKGDITTATPPRNLADYFVGVLMGISTLARTGAASKENRNYADVALGALE